MICMVLCTDDFHFSLTSLSPSCDSGKNVEKSVLVLSFVLFNLFYYLLISQMIFIMITRFSLNELI